MSSAQDKGREYEREFAKKYDLKEVPGSGSQPFRKLDVEGTSIIFSLKYTEKESFRVTNDMLDEVYEVVRGPGGLGGDFVGALVFSLKGKEYVTLDINDLVKLLSEKAKVFKVSKTDAKYQKSEIPGLFRKQEYE